MYIKKDILGNTVSTIQTLVMKVIMIYVFKYTISSLKIAVHQIHVQVKNLFGSYVPQGTEMLFVDQASICGGILDVQRIYQVR